MKTIPQFLLLAASSVLLGACSRSQPPATPTTTSQSASNANVGAETQKCSGVVTDAAGKPVAGATVEYWNYGTDSVQTRSMERQKQTIAGTNGTYEIQGVGNTGVLLARKPGLSLAWCQLGRPFRSADGSDNNLVMTPPTVLAGTVVDESNRPVASAEVFVAEAANEITLENGARTVSLLGGKAARAGFAARTDTAGHFRIENFPSYARAMLAVGLPGKALRQAPMASISFETLPFQAGQQDIRLVVEPAGAIEGKIVASPGLRPLPIARLTLQPNQSGVTGVDTLEPAQSGADGSFCISNLPAGSYLVRAMFGSNAAPDWVAESVAVSVESGQTTHGVQVTPQRGGVLEVAVVNEGDHKPVAQASVTARLQNSQFSTAARSDDNGSARMRLIPGDYQIYTVRPPATSSQTSVVVEAGVTNRVEIEIIGPQRITGVVRQPNGQPAAGVPVRMVGPGGSMAFDIKTDATGKFELEWDPRRVVPGNFTPCILVRDPEHNLAAAQDLDEESTNLDLKLAPALTLAGRVECDGKPVTNATAQVIFWTGRSGMYLYGLTRTNTPGQYEISALPPGRRYGVVVTAPGYGQKQMSSFEAAAEPGRQELDPVELKLANLKLAGQVLDADDKPVAGCSVNLNGDGQPNGNVRTDREGRFAFDRVCEGPVRLSANSQQNYGNVTAEGGDTNVVLRLGQTYSSSSSVMGHKLTGTVKDLDGKPAAGAQLAVFPSSGLRQWAKAGPNGAFNLTWSLQQWQMQNGGALLIVRDPARNLAASGELTEDSTNLDVQLKPGLTVIGRVEGTNGAPLAHVQIGYWLRAGNTYEQMDQTPAAADADGRFEIKCLPPEPQFLVFASAKGYGRSQQWVGPGAETNRVELAPFTLKPADRIIAGQVLDADDKPVSGVSVRLLNVIASGEGQPEGDTTTDRNGKFRLQVCEGQVRLYANSQNGNGYAQATAEAGDNNIVINLRSSSVMASQPPRASLKGGSLPDLTGVNLAADAAPAGQPVLLCLFDAGQRPSRHVVQQLETQAAALRQRNICVLGVQAVPASDDVFDGWKTASPVSFSLGRVATKSANNRWATDVSVLPWFILTDASHRVVAEGFPPDELDAQVEAMQKAKR